ncbi:MAG: alkaline phosphatase family protein [Chitinophagaceae bacterium]|nr:alkaline phosphatase family protein [Chitinophagaceae bacterium]
MKGFFLMLWITVSVTGFAQQTTVFQPKQASVERPRLVVGIMVDQMRWDYLYRYYDRYAPNGGFRRLLNQGFSCENAFIPYTPTATGCGHAAVYTGASPAINGITGNNWWDAKLQRNMYCVEDKSVKTVGSDTRDGEMSPRNMMSNTVTDELRLATNFKSKSIGISIKDRGAILPAGHSGTAYWYDEARGVFVSSTYYMDQLPAWAQEFNNRKLPDAYYREGWNTLYPIQTYINSGKDSAVHERTDLLNKTTFPYDTRSYAGTNYGKLPYMPQGATYTFEMAKAAMVGEQLGKRGITDFLTVSISSPDYMGHTYGPNSVEAEDTYLRLDRDLGAFLNYLDAQLGKGQYLVFLTADHGAAHVPGFLKEYKLPGGSIPLGTLVKKVNDEVANTFGIKNAIIFSTYYNLSLNTKMLDSLKLDVAETVKQYIIHFFEHQEGIFRVVDKSKLGTAILPNPVRERLINGFYPYRSGDLQVIPEPQWFKDNPKGTDHSVWNPYDSHIPLLWYGWNIKPGRSTEEVYMTDIAATVAAMLRIQMPNGCVGKPIQAVMK